MFTEAPSDLISLLVREPGSRIAFEAIVPILVLLFSFLAIFHTPKKVEVGYAVR